jgi:hypothetical protein
MVQDKKKGMEDSSADKKGRMPGKEDMDKKSSIKPTATPNKTDTSSTRKSR